MNWHATGHRKLERFLALWRREDWRMAAERKGTPARESRTGTRLVSPAAGCEKKEEDTSGTVPQNTKMNTLKNIIGIYNKSTNV